MGENKKIEKYIFIDTNIFLSCALEQLQDLNLEILEKFKEKLDEEKIHLIIPENIKAEINFGLRNEFKKLEEGIKNTLSDKRLDDLKKESNLLVVALQNGKKEALNKLSENQKAVIKIIDDIFKHKNSIIIELSDKILANGMKRASLKKRPFTTKAGSFIKDQDCIALESILHYLSTKTITEEMEVILCSDDGDYYDDINNKELHVDIKNEFKKLKLSCYRSPIEMMNAEFKDKYSLEQSKQFEELKQESIGFGYSGIGLCDPVIPSINNLSLSSRHILDWPLLDNLGFSQAKEEIIKFCPFCGKNIEILGLKRKTPLNGVSLGTISLGPSFNHKYCPFCAKNLKELCE